MQRPIAIKTLLNVLIAIVWLANGLICKVLNLVPRHQLIIARILGEQHAPLFTMAIGVSEILMAVWIISRIMPKLCAITQMLIVMLMNIIEFTLAPDLLLFGHINLLIAIGFVAVIYFDTFVINQRHHNQ